jgi:hypothetical protein
LQGVRLQNVVVIQDCQELAGGNFRHIIRVGSDTPVFGKIQNTHARIPPCKVKKLFAEGGLDLLESETQFPPRKALAANRFDRLAQPRWGGAVSHQKDGKKGWLR